MYYRGAAAAILVYDICNPSSFDALPMWLQRLKEFGPKETINNEKNPLIIIIVGNKCDLDSERLVLRESAELFASSQRCLYIESSARDGINVEEIFQQIARLLPGDKISCSTSGNHKHGDVHPDDDILKLQDPQNRFGTMASYSSLKRRVCEC
jgi:GTPase SAR1 family protein